MLDVVMWILVFVMLLVMMKMRMVLMIYSDTVGGGRLLLAAVQCAAELCDVGGGDIGRGDATVFYRYSTEHLTIWILS